MKIRPYKNFMKIRSVRAELLHADRHDERIYNAVLRVLNFNTVEPNVRVSGCRCCYTEFQMVSAKLGDELTFWSRNFTFKF